MALSAVASTRSGPITTITLDRSLARNAVDGPAAQELADAFRAFDRDDRSAVAILTGAGDTFCAGADLKAVGTERSNRLDAHGDGPMGPTRMQLSKPVIAAIEGYAVAGGLELALWCDLRVVGTSAEFGVYCRRWGVPLIDGGTVRLPKLIGHGRAMDLVLTGRTVGAAEALQMGLVSRVVADGTALSAAIALAQEIARFPQVCLRHDRLSLLEAHGLSEPAALANEFAHGMHALRSGETQQGAARFAAGAGRHGSMEDLT